MSLTCASCAVNILIEQGMISACKFEYRTGNEEHSTKERKDFAAEMEIS